MIEIGFTGSREGMTDKQKELLISILDINLQEHGIMAVHHGDCVGSDEMFHDLCIEREIPIIIHPPIETYYRSFCESENKYPEKTYFERNRDIVDLSEVLIATPNQMEKRNKGGTWYTINYAIKKNRGIFILTPEGGLEYDVGGKR